MDYYILVMTKGCIAVSQLYTIVLLYKDYRDTKTKNNDKNNK